MIGRALFVAAALLLAPASGHSGEGVKTLAALLARYHCTVADRLEQIYRATDSANPQNWFLIVYFAVNPSDYVQCVFDTKTRMLCEAASGFYDKVATEPRTRRLSPSVVAALGAILALKAFPSPKLNCLRAAGSEARFEASGISMPPFGLVGVINDDAASDSSLSLIGPSLRLR